jgi:uncharacterized protein (TIGR03084 family)
MAEPQSLEELLADLREEGEELDRMVSGMPAEAWELPTPAEKWTIGHQIAHLAATDEELLLAIREPEVFRRQAAAEDSHDTSRVDREAAVGLRNGLELTLGRWRASRAAVLAAAQNVDPRGRVPWHGPSMSLRTALTARLMETWAHGQDVADALSIHRAPKESLRHIVTLAVLARDFSFQAHGLKPPASPFRVQLTSPSGTEWTWGPDNAPENITGVAVDFALLAVQRRHRGDCRVTANGATANTWLDIIQAYAGPPGKGRQPTT